MKPLRPLLLSLLLALSLPAVAADGFLADRHVKAGVACQSCHGPDLKNPVDPTLDDCTKCHSLKPLVEKTKDVKGHNPHTSPHYQDQLDCINCHFGHAEGENFCNQCHTFDFKVP
ncbi:cytochrome c3 family protein [Sutterella sp.]|uniref:cytochrome c3 family protein n=1 Tax=Sutterella sp. TaxID=1981025 RepID=UPI0026E05BF4|nr:cytochrome c3 family protein [Sutterella sp.]MDO5531687.1 cytochrome c3 family protein [Sutterella sp.]